jgi:Domain of unknown function (DUF4397)
MTIKKFISIGAAVLLLFSACKKDVDTQLLDENNKWMYVDSTTTGYLKVVHAFPSLTPGVGIGTGPKVMVYMDNQRLLRDSVAYNGTFPAQSGVYSAIPAGNHNFYYILSRPNGANTVAGDTVFKNSATIAAGKYYTTFLLDTTPNPLALTVPDNWTVPTPSFYQLRYANLVANPTDSYDVYSIRQAGNIFTNVGYKQVTNFINMPIPLITDTFIVRKAGTMTLIDTLKGFSGVPQRVYTLYTRGKAGIATSRNPATTFYTNR